MAKELYAINIWLSRKLYKLKTLRNVEFDIFSSLPFQCLYMKALATALLSIETSLNDWELRRTLIRYPYKTSDATTNKLSAHL